MKRHDLGPDASQRRCQIMLGSSSFSWFSSNPSSNVWSCGDSTVSLGFFDDPLSFFDSLWS